MLRRKKPMNRIGRKGKEWIKIRNQEFKKLNDLGINACEQCGTKMFLTPAHRKKRRDCDEAELRIFAILCTTCHQKAEDVGHEKMFHIINNIIEKRSV